MEIEFISVTFVGSTKDEKTCVFKPCSHVTSVFAFSRMESMASSGSD